MSWLEPILSIIALVIAIIGSLPLLIAIIIYIALKPKLSVFFASKSGTYESIVPFATLKHENAVINICLLMDKGVYVRVEFLIDKPWKFHLERIRHKHLITREGFKIVLLDEEFIEARGTLAMAFPFELPQEPEECNFTIVLYPSIESKTLGLLHIFGKFNLKPITRNFRIVC